MPWVGFLSASADNRNLIPPASAVPQQLLDYALWQPGSHGLPACAVGGSRNTDTILARVSLGLVVSAPTTVQPPPAIGQAARFVVMASEQRGVDEAGVVPHRRALARVVRPGRNPQRGDPATNLTQAGAVTVNAHSSVSREVYLPAGQASTDVLVSDGTITTRLTLRLSAPAGGVTLAPSGLVVSPPINISAENISAENISAENISAENISAENISAENISAENISAENMGIQETTWLVQATGDANKSYVACRRSTSRSRSTTTSGWSSTGCRRSARASTAPAR